MISRIRRRSSSGSCRNRYAASFNPGESSRVRGSSPASRKILSGGRCSTSAIFRQRSELGLRLPLTTLEMVDSLTSHRRANSRIDQRLSSSSFNNHFPKADLSVIPMSPFCTLQTCCALPAYAPDALGAPTSSSDSLAFERWQRQEANRSSERGLLPGVLISRRSSMSGLRREPRATTRRRMSLYKISIDVSSIRHVHVIPLLAQAARCVQPVRSGGKIFPGFRMLSGSNTCLMPRCSAMSLASITMGK